MVARRCGADAVLWEREPMTPMVPGTREPHPAGVTSEDTGMPVGGYVHDATPPLPDHTGRAAHSMMWLVDRLIALMRTAPAP
ncbi:MAG: hypothetical protein ABL982_20665 [Vicinamibacterales bacterium]